MAVAKGAVMGTQTDSASNSTTSDSPPQDSSSRSQQRLSVAASLTVNSRTD
jgi:hypothetical protein